MFDLFLSPQSMPFAVALAVVAGLFILELISSLLGATVLGLDSDGPDADLDPDFDLAADFDLDTDLDIGVVEDLSLDVDSEAPVLAPALAEKSTGLLNRLGMRDVPFLIWLVSFLTMFGLSGLIIQSIAISILKTPIIANLAVVLAIVPALAVTRFISNWVSLLMPKTTTSAMRTRFLGGHRGVITQGTASRGKPAEAKIKDRYGNFHYLRVEPLDDDGQFPKGSDVTIIRKRDGKFFVI